ncbi:MAG: PD-(D/E)XK nuclease family protein [Patescibacteria group bacterium]
MPLSFTQLSTYRRCPRQYEYLYVKKIPKGISPGEAFGSAVHNTLKKWGEREIENGEWRIENSTKQMEMFTESVVPQVSALSLGALEKIWHENFPLNSFSTRVEADAARMRGEELMTYFYSWWSELPREVVAVEKGFSVQMNNEELAMSNDKKSQIINRQSQIVLTGRFDRIERTPEGLHVIDFKTSKPRTQAEVDADLQLSIYALATLEDFGELPAVLSLLHITEDGVLEIQTTRNEGQVRDAVKQIGAIHGRIAEKDFVPTPAVAVCKYCPYRGVCDVAAV